MVFPVPGGPCSKNTFLDDRAFEMASFCGDQGKMRQVLRLNPGVVYNFINMDSDDQTKNWQTHTQNNKNSYIN